MGQCCNFDCDNVLWVGALLCVGLSVDRECSMGQCCALTLSQCQCHSDTVLWVSAVLCVWLSVDRECSMGQCCALTL